MRMRHTVVCGLPVSTVSSSPHYLKKGTIFENVNGYKMCVFVSSITFVRNISHSKNKWAKYDQKMCIALPVKYLIFLSDFNKTLIFSTCFRKILKYNIFVEFLLVETEMFHADGRTDKHDEANNNFSQFCEGAFKKKKKTTTVDTSSDVTYVTSYRVVGHTDVSE